MSFGLLNLVTGIMGSPDQIPNSANDADLRQSLLAEVLAERDENGTVVKPANLFNLKPEEAMQVIQWASDHAMDFFMRGLESAADLSQKVQPRMEALQALTRSQSGTEV